MALEQVTQKGPDGPLETTTSFLGKLNQAKGSGFMGWTNFDEQAIETSGWWFEKPRREEILAIWGGLKV